MKTVLITLLWAAALVVVGAAAFIYSGAFSVAATDHHWFATYWVMEQARMRSIQVRAAGLFPPSGYDQPAKIEGAVGHFAEHCAACHGAPGTKPTEAMEGMYPQPPSLSEASKRYTAGELFWVLKNGIKMSGMPSMASDGDEMLWSTVAFLQKLPGMSDEQYNDLWMSSQAQGGMEGMNMDHGSMAKKPWEGTVPSSRLQVR
jgi:mono/diheme cytochrome c family protein